MQTVDARLIDRVPVSASAVVVSLAGVPFARDVKPGQFVMVRVSGRIDPLLARPYSVYDADGEMIRVLVKVVGRGTRLLAALEFGSPVQVTGPLGNRFRVARTGPILMVAGGCGAAPFLLVARGYPKREKVLVYGAPSREECVRLEPFERFGVKTICLTEDGSAGRKGLVTRPLKGLLKSLGPDVTILGCGPTPMLKALAGIAGPMGLRVQLSLEERMACGIGVCQGCAVKVRWRDTFRYKLVCGDGPVFYADQLVLDGDAPS